MASRGVVVVVVVVVVVGGGGGGGLAHFVGHARSVGSLHTCFDFVRRLALKLLPINVTLIFDDPNFNSMYYQLISCSIFALLCNTSPRQTKPFQSKN